MSVFKVNQRVRITKAGTGQPSRNCAGSEGTITALFIEDVSPRFRRAHGDHHRVQVDGVPSPHPGGWQVPVSYLAPLTDPKADAFIESVKKWKPEPVAPALPAKVHQ